MTRTTKRNRFSMTGVALVAGLLASSGMAAQAAEPVYQPNSALARWLLPYSPFVFDLVVQGARSVAEISYGQRRYDPITESFMVTDLHIRRQAIDVSIRRLRLGEDMTMAEGVAFDTRFLDLPPPLREGLKQLDREIVVADIVGTLKRDDARSALAVDASIDLADIGSIALSAAVDNFHILVPLSELDGDFSGEPVVAGVLTGASFSYRDAGLADVAAKLAASQQGVTVEDLRNGIAVLPLMRVGDMLDSLPGGASPALRQRAEGWARVVESFIRTPDVIRVSLDPTEPFPLARLQSGRIDEETITALNPQLGAGAVPATVASPPSDPASAAVALIDGNAMPQDRESGAKALLALAGGGKLDAVERLANAFGSTSLPDLQPAELADLYKFLLVARALDQRVSDDVLASLTRRLDPTVSRGAEVAASAYFHGMSEVGRALVPLTADSIRQYDASKLRTMAYDAYEGRGVTRDFTEAYAIALVAAAAGDPLASSLRDHLAKAAQEKRIALSLSESRARAAALWTGYSGDKTTQP